MSGPEYLALAWRLPAYQGVLAARIAAEEEEAGSEGPRRRQDTRPERYVPVDQRSELVDVHHPAFAGMIDWG